jgi:hypothetical protein
LGIEQSVLNGDDARVAVSIAPSPLFQHPQNKTLNMPDVQNMSFSEFKTWAHASVQSGGKFYVSGEATPKIH